MNTTNDHIQVKRLQLDVGSGALVASPKKKLFLKGPIPIGWLTKAAQLPGKTINVALAVWWRHGMAKGEPFKLTRLALASVCVGEEAASDGLTRLHQAGLIQVERKPGQRPTIVVVAR